MCKDGGVKTIGELLEDVEPTAVDLLTVAGLATTVPGEAAITLLEQAAEDATMWQVGLGTAGEMIQVVTDLSHAWSALPIPAEYQAFGNLVAAAIIAILRTLEGNQPAPAPAPGTEVTATPEEIQLHHQAAVISQATAEIQALVPGFQRAIFSSPAHQYKSLWNKAVDENPALRIAKVA